MHEARAESEATRKDCVRGQRRVAEEQCPPTTSSAAVKVEEHCEQAIPKTMYGRRGTASVGSVKMQGYDGEQRQESDVRALGLAEDVETDTVDTIVRL